MPPASTTRTVDPPELATLEELICVLLSRGRGLRRGTYAELNMQQCQWTKSFVADTVNKWRGYSDDDLQLRLRRYAMPAQTSANPAVFGIAVVLCVYVCVTLIFGTMAVSPLSVVLNDTLWNTIA